MRIFGVLAGVSVLLGGGVCGAQESPWPHPVAIPQSTPALPCETVAIPQPTPALPCETAPLPQVAACPVGGLPAAAPAYMDPRTHAWQQHQIPPAEQLNASESCHCSGACLKDRRKRCWYEVICDGYRLLQKLLTEPPRHPAGASGVDVSQCGGAVPTPE